MTCHDAREQLSAYLDDALAPEERREVAAHLEGCAECRRELARLEATVTLLRRVEPVRAPVGFVDRVVEAAGPRPWYRRVAAAVFLPFSVKLPAEATALLMVALLAVYVFERTPALQESARRLEPAREQPAAPPASAPTAPQPSPQPSPQHSIVRPPAPGPEALRKQRREEKARDAAPELEQALKDARRRDAGERAGGASPGPAPASPPRASAPVAPPAQAPPAASPPPVAAPPATTPPMAAESRPERSPAAPAPAAPGPRAKTEAPAENPAGENRQQSVDSARSAATSSPRLAAKRAAPADVVARIAVRDRETAEVDLAALIGRVGGRETGRRREEEATVVEAIVPQARYAEFTQGLAALGTWKLEADRPDLPAEVRVILRLQ